MLNRPFNPMETARNFYERKKRFLLTDKILAVDSSQPLDKSWILRLIALNKLPQEIQDLLHQGKKG